MTTRFKRHIRTKEDEIIGLPNIEYFEVYFNDSFSGMIPESDLSNYYFEQIQRSKV